MATIGTHYILTALGGAKARGIDTKALLKKARIPEKLLKNPKARFHVDLVARLYADIAQALNDEFMGFTEKPIKVGTFELMADWVSHSTTLEELLQKGIRFYNQITDEVQVSLEVEDEHVYFTSTFRRPELDFEHFYIEYWHVIWHRFASWYIGKPIKLLGAYVNYTPLDPDEFEVLYRCPTYLKSKVNRLVFHRKYLEEPLIKTQRDLQVFLRRAPIDLLTIPGEDTSLTARINQMLEPKNFKEEDRLILPGSEAISKQLGMSEQTLRRKLSVEGISYQQIKDNLRHDLANKLLSNRSLTISHIAKQLSFSEPRAFTRAYKHWSGVTPKEYRQLRLAKKNRS
ncbi:MAG: AraC family transcriptional regulator [Bermanella sp.]